MPEMIRTTPTPTDRGYSYAAFVFLFLGMLCNMLLAFGSSAATGSLRVFEPEILRVAPEVMRGYFLATPWYAAFLGLVTVMSIDNALSRCCKSYEVPVMIFYFLVQVTTLHIMIGVWLSAGFDVAWLAKYVEIFNMLYIASFGCILLLYIAETFLSFVYRGKVGASVFGKNSSGGFDIP